MSNHPNAAAAGSTASIGVIIVWLAGHFGFKLGAEEAAAITAVAVTLVLFIGRNGLRGLARIVWRGNGTI